MDRNVILLTLIIGFLASLSARRAWIEILILLVKFVCFAVALRKESVDRNDNGNAVAVSDLGRSPQGERG